MVFDLLQQPFLELPMKSLLWPWLVRSIPIVGVHYMLILIMWGHDPAPVTQALILPAIWDHPNPLWQDTTLEIPKFMDLLIGPFLLLWYKVNQKHLHFNTQFVQAILLVFGSIVLMFESLTLGLIFFVTTGWLIAKQNNFSPAITQVALFGYAMFFIMWTFPSISLGLLGWCVSFLALIVGFCLGVVSKQKTANKL